MALSSELISLLNDFARTQPALRLPGEPLETSNPNLGDALETQISTAQTATGTAYTPGDGSHWADPDPTTTKEALDRIAAAVYSLQTNTEIA